jgi:KUP system potassium uptake protein
MVLTIALTIAFGSSERLAGAYGTAVSTTMLITTCLLYNAMRDRWAWPVPLALSTAGLFLAVDLAFFSANLLKIAAGGWLPLLFGASIFIIMTTWRRGIEAMQTMPSALTRKPAWFIELLSSGIIPRVPGTAVFLSRTATPVSSLMLRHIKQIGALHALIVSLTVEFEEVPRVPLSERVEVERIAEDFWHVIVRYGFVEIPNLPVSLNRAKSLGCPVDLDDAVYFGAHDEVVRSMTGPRLSPWRRMLFGFLHRNGVRAVDRFNLPAKQFLDIGSQVEL